METWEIQFKKSFQKEYRKLNQRNKDKWSIVFEVFYKNPLCKSLRRHKLKGKYQGFESIDISPDIRAVFRQTGNTFYFWHIRNHNQLYN